MTDMEQELLRRALIDLFLASPRRGTRRSQRDNQKERHKKKSSTAKTNDKHSGEETHGQEK
jgi:hypothetical protein